jgi:arylformamidase
MNKKIYDISMSIHPTMQVYKNYEHKKPRFTIHNDFKTHGTYETDLAMNLHTGTHIDFPLHMIEHGANSDSESLLKLFSEAIVYDLAHVEGAIEAHHLQSLTFKPNTFALFKTKNSFSETFLFDFVYVSQSAAEFLITQPILGVGVDGLGIERAQEGHPTHHLLLGKNIIIIEGLRLKAIQPGSYEFICLPIKIAGVEALPCRAVLIG